MFHLYRAKSCIYSERIDALFANELFHLDPRKRSRFEVTADMREDPVNIIDDQNCQICNLRKFNSQTFEENAEKFYVHVDSSGFNDSTFRLA